MYPPSFGQRLKMTKALFRVPTEAWPRGGWQGIPMPESSLAIFVGTIHPDRGVIDMKECKCNQELLPKELPGIIEARITG